MSTYAPRTADEVAEAIRGAVASGESLEVVGAGSRRTLGRAVSASNTLDVSGIAGILSYEPAELVLTAAAGTPLHVIETALAEGSQMLTFEPPDFAPLLGTDAKGSFGGVVATGLSGPRRFRAGAVRDHVLGISAVSGRGEVFVGGGKVVKNVTGYDIPKLMTGSYGTLAVLTEITVKVLPAPEDTRTLVVSGLGTHDAVRAMTSVLQSTADVSGACYLPAGVDAPGIATDESATVFRLEGVTPSVEFRLSRLREQFASAGEQAVLDREASQSFWRSIRDVAPFVDASFGSVWRLSAPPAEGAAVAERIERSCTGAKWYLDWAGGLIWVATGTERQHPAHIREALGATGGHATLIRAPAVVRANVDVFHPQSIGVASLSKRVKHQFDPARVLNPGRMYADL